MLKNSNDTIKAADSSAEKPTAYIPMLFTAASTYGGASWALPVDLDTVSQYYNVVTDTIADPSGPEGTYTEADIIRATAADLAECDLAIVIVNNPQNENGQNGGYDAATKTYYPLSLQYGEYTANSVGVRTQSISGDSQQVEVISNPYVSGQMSQKENRAYYGKASRMTNVSNLEGIQNAIANLPESASIIVCANCDKAMIVSEFEADVDAILVGFGIDNNYFLQVTSGNYEPCGLLPLQFPSGMETVETQKEDVPRDMECYVDADGNTYDFAYGLNWSGVIKDERVSTYSAAPLTSPESITITYAK